MKQFCLLLAFILAIPALSPAQDAYASDVESIDNIIAALYDVISGEKGVKRDWDRFKNLFIEEARLMPSGKNKEGATSYRIMSPDEYVENAGKWLEENGFFESEISRKTEVYGSMAHVFSSYDSRRSAADAKPFARGINSIQLMHDGSRWKIISIYWLGETADNLLPDKYLSKD
jgi:hypothetical protein